MRQYEPFFSTTLAFEAEDDLVEHGVTPVLHYDPLGRLVRTELPNGTQARVQFSPWEQRSYDPNDEVLGSAWYAERIALPVGDPERRAALLTEAHADTPTVTHLDHLGRAFLAIEHNRDPVGADVFYETRALLDVQGNVLRIIDANGTIAEERAHGMLEQLLRTTSLEVGNRWALTDVHGAPLYATASRGFATRHRYDQARRPTHTVVTRPNGTTFTATRIVYGEAAPAPTTSNLRGRVFRIYDELDDLQPVFVVFDVEPEDQEALIDAIRTLHDEVILGEPGFVSTNLHASLDGRRLINYGQWASKAHYERFLAGTLKRAAPPLFAKYHPDSCPFRLALQVLGGGRGNRDRTRGAPSEPYARLAARVQAMDREPSAVKGTLSRRAHLA